MTQIGYNLITNLTVHSYNKTHLHLQRFAVTRLKYT